MYSCTVRAAQYGSITQRSNIETRESSETKLGVRGALICLLVQSMLTGNSGGFVALLNGTVGAPPLQSDDPEYPAVSTIAPKNPVSVRAGLTQTALA